MGLLMTRFTAMALPLAACVPLYAMVLPVCAADISTTSGATSGAVNEAGTATAGDAALVGQVAARLGHVKGIRARFVQTQTLAVMREPLVSSGSLLLFRDKGVVWRIDTPYKAVYVITDAGVSEWDEAGHRLKSGGGNGVRGVAQVSRMMRAMLGGDLSALYSQFDVHASGTVKAWTMRLTPNQPQLAQSIAGLQMSGGDFLQRLTIVLANHDTIQIVFADNVALDALSADEHAQFGVP
jgi:outer membrane lipoprotein-sorting protein